MEGVRYTTRLKTQVGEKDGRLHIEHHGIREEGGDGVGEDEISVR